MVVQTGNQYNNWTATVLGQLASLGAGARPDFVIYHRYDGGPGSEVDATLLHGTSTWGSDATDLRTQVDAAFGANNIEIVVTENNSVYSNPGKQSTSLVNGLFLADSLASVMPHVKSGSVKPLAVNAPDAPVEVGRPTPVVQSKELAANSKRRF